MKLIYLSYHFYISHLTSHISYLISHISYLISHISYLISHISYLISHIITPVTATHFRQYNADGKNYCPATKLLLRNIIQQSTTPFFGSFHIPPFALSIVFNLFFGNFTYTKILRLRMCKYKTRYRCIREHGIAFS